MLCLRVAMRRAGRCSESGGGGGSVLSFLPRSMRWGWVVDHFYHAAYECCIAVLRIALMLGARGVEEEIGRVVGCEVDVVLPGLCIGEAPCRIRHVCVETLTLVWSWPRVSGVPFSAGLQFSAAKFACHYLTLPI